MTYPAILHMKDPDDDLDERLMLTIYGDAEGVNKHYFDLDENSVGIPFGEGEHYPGDWYDVLAEKEEAHYPTGFIPRSLV